MVFPYFQVMLPFLNWTPHRPNTHTTRIHFARQKVLHTMKLQEQNVMQKEQPIQRMQFATPQKITLSHWLFFVGYVSYLELCTFGAQNKLCLLSASRESRNVPTAVSTSREFRPVSHSMRGCSQMSCCLLQCSHRMQAASTDSEENLLANLLLRPVWTGPQPQVEPEARRSFGLIHTGLRMRNTSKWDLLLSLGVFTHCWQATSKEKRSNLPAHCIACPVWIRPSFPPLFTSD